MKFILLHEFSYFQKKKKSTISKNTLVTLRWWSGNESGSEFGGRGRTVWASSIRSSKGIITILRSKLVHILYLEILSLIVRARSEDCNEFGLSSEITILTTFFRKNENIKVVFGREFPQINVAECICRHILRDTIFL